MSREQGYLPAFARGDLVEYTDNHGRRVAGKIRSITAQYLAFQEAGYPPLVTYEVTHPSYNGRLARVSPQSMRKVEE